MKKLIVLLFFIPVLLFAQSGVIKEPKVNAQTVAGYPIDSLLNVPSGGNVSNTGTPANNQLGIWTDATTIEGDADLTWDGTELGVLSKISSNTPSYVSTLEWFGAKSLYMISSPLYEAYIGIDNTNHLDFYSDVGYEFSGVGVLTSGIDDIFVSTTATDFKKITKANFLTDMGLISIYGTQGFADASETLTMSEDVYALITNAGSNLYTTGINSGLTFTGDSIQVPSTDHYSISWDLSYSGANTDEYHIEIYVNGVGQSGKGETIRDMTGSSIGVSAGHTILSLTANDWLSLRIANINNNNDATVKAGNIVVERK